MLWSLQLNTSKARNIVAHLGRLVSVISINARQPVLSMNPEEDPLSAAAAPEG